MRNKLTVFVLFFASFLSAQTSSFIATRIRAEEYLRIGANSSQKVTGFNTSIVGAGSNEKLPTTKAVVDYLTAGFVPIGYYTEGTGIDITGGVISNTGDLSATNELNVSMYVTGSSISLDDAGGSVTMPISQLRPHVYSAGTGISINNGTGVITNTLPNIVQTLSIAGQDLTLSGGGGTVVIPADGNGIYGGSGTVIDEGVAKTRLFRFKTDDDPTYNTDGFFSEMVFGGIYSMSTGAFAELPGFNTIVAGTPGASNVFATFNFDGEQGLIDIKSSDGGGGIAGIAVGSAFVSINTIPTTGGNFAMTYDFNGAIFSDQRTVTKGIEYFDDYSADFTERSLIDKEYADTHSGSALGTGFVDGGGAGTIPAGTVAETGLSSFIYGYDSNPDAIAWQWDNTTGKYQKIINNGDGLDIGSFDDFNGSSMRMVLSGGTGNFSAFNGTLEFTAKSNGTISFDQQECFVRFSSLDNNVIFEDTRATPKGFEYATYYPDIESNPQSFTDVQTVNSIKQKLAPYTESERDAISSPVTGYVIFCTDATATDSSTGVMQVWNGTTWKNAW